MSNHELPWYPWYPAAFAASTVGWSFRERAVYRALLDLQWQRGLIYEDLKRLSETLGIDLRTLQKCWTVVGPKFARAEGGLKNHRLEQHRLRALELHKKKVESGRSGGLSRQAQLKAVLKQTSSTASSSAEAALKHLTSKNKNPLSLPSPRKRAANGQEGRGAPERGETGALREDDPEVQRKRREAESLAAQHAKSRDDDMPF